MPNNHLTVAAQNVTLEIPIRIKSVTFSPGDTTAGAIIIYHGKNTSAKIGYQVKIAANTHLAARYDGLLFRDGVTVALTGDAPFAVIEYDPAI